jgi:hypothetical protein|tara:strand:+ start:512 stop:1015 length:504 start_codon:yes stop_codon:yes gene_type:complete
MENYDNLVKKYSKKIPYDLLLSTKEWLEKRRYILSRDQNRCKKCDKKGSLVEAELAGVKVLVRNTDGVILQIHHKYYAISNKVLSPPWDYDDDCFITLCLDCHKKTHEEEVIPIRDGDKELDLNTLTTCLRCNGLGWLPKFSYHLGGVCFKCNGARYVEFSQKQEDN